MTKLNQIYKCEVCGNIVEILHTGQGELVCCEQPMKLQIEKEEDEGQEKHVPVIKKTAEGVLIKVGETPHPMKEEHFIEWVEVISTKGKVYRKFLQASDNPQAEFCLEESIALARIYCNVHGLWINK